MKARRIAFRRVVTKSLENPSPAPPGAGERHPPFGALEDVTFVPPGDDLTAPADPDWGKVYDD